MWQDPFLSAVFAAMCTLIFLTKQTGGKIRNWSLFFKRCVKTPRCIKWCSYQLLTQHIISRCHPKGWRAAEGFWKAFIFTPNEVWSRCLVACKFVHLGRLAPSYAENRLEGIVKDLEPCLCLFVCKAFLFLYVTSCACHWNDQAVSLWCKMSMIQFQQNIYALSNISRT